MKTLEDGITLDTPNNRARLAKREQWHPTANSKQAIKWRQPVATHRTLIASTDMQAGRHITPFSEGIYGRSTTPNSEQSIKHDSNRYQSSFGLDLEGEYDGS